MTNIPEDPAQSLSLTVDIVSSYVSSHRVDLQDLPKLISTVFSALSQLGRSSYVPESPRAPAVPIRASVKPDYIICLEDGKKLKMLKRHLMTRYKLTPEAYRAKWGLPPEYPMVAPNYAAQRSYFAKKNGLGTKRGGRR